MFVLYTEMNKPQINSLQPQVSNITSHAFHVIHFFRTKNSLEQSSELVWNIHQFDLPLRLSRTPHPSVYLYIEYLQHYHTQQHLYLQITID